MRVMHVIEIRGIGGAEKLLIDFLPAQVSMGIPVICIIVYFAKHENAATTIINELKSGGVTTKSIKLGNSFSLLSLPSQVKKIILEQNPDLIHTHLRLAELVIAGLKKFGLSIPTCSTIHGFWDKLNLFKLRMFIVKKLIKNFDGLVFVSNYAQDFYRKHHLINNINTISVINNGYKVEHAAQGVLPAKNININELKIVLAGRLIEWKGHKYAIEAVQILIKKYPGIKLDFYGAGDYEPSIKNKIDECSLQESVFLKGFDINIKKIMRTYDIALVPSFFEAFGIVFLDAFGAGLPVVAFDLPSGNELITHKVNGLLAQPYNSQSLADNIEQLILDDDLRKSIIENAYNALVEKFSIEEMVNQYSLFYTNILKAY